MDASTHSALTFLALIGAFFLLCAGIAFGAGLYAFLSIRRNRRRFEEHRAEVDSFLNPARRRRWPL